MSEHRFESAASLPEAALLDRGPAGADGLELLWCAGCTAPAPHEVPACPDGHGDDCPERVCVVCGCASWGAGPVAQPAASRTTPASIPVTAAA